MFFQVFERDLIQLPLKLREKVYALPGIMQASRADSTINKYCNSFLRFKKWAKEQGIEESELFPSKPLHVSIYLACLVQRANSPSPIVDAFYGIKWAHDLVGFNSPTDNQFVKNIMEGGKRIVAKPVQKKEPITVENLRCMYLKLFECNNLYNQRIICMVLLAFAGFLRSSELINIKRSDIQFLPDHIEIFIESSKTDIYRDGTRVVIARTFSYMCPVSNFELYLRLAGIQDDSEEYVFCAISKSGSGYRLRNREKPLSYTRVRELFIEAFTGIVDNIKVYGLHSLRSGGATASAVRGIPDRIFKRHGRWRSESAKDGYVQDPLSERLSVSKELGL